VVRDQRSVSSTANAIGLIFKIPVPFSNYNFFVLLLLRVFTDRRSGFIDP